MNSSFLEKNKYLFLSLIPIIILLIVFSPYLFKEDVYEIYLNGEESETYLVNHYTDKGALALKNDFDVSNRIMLESNIEADKEGDYEIFYSIYGKSRSDKYEVKRNVHIVDLKINRRVDIQNHKIIINVLSDLYSYATLPNGNLTYDRYIEYQYDSDGTYDFEFFINDELSKKYHFKVSNFDNDGPEVSCKMTYNGKNIIVNVDAFDNSGISKYVYNNNDYYVNNFSLELSDISSDNIVRVYDNLGNYSDTKCTGIIEKGFKEIIPASEKLGYYSCGMDSSFANNNLSKIISIHGNKTRDSVVAAALYLTNFPYKISYTWGGKYLNFGMNPSWGCKVNVTENKCTNPLGGNSCEGGLDCTGFTAWAFAQAGFDKSIIRTSSQSTGMWGDFNAYYHRYSFSGNQDKVNLIKPGDIVHTEGHVGIVIGVSDDTLQVSNMTGPIIITIIKKSNGRSINSQHSFDNFVLFDEFFNIYGSN